MNKGLFFTLAGAVVIAGCGVPQDDYNNLKLENERLKLELDEYQNGAERLIALTERAYQEKDYAQARQSIELLYSKHPESPKNIEFKTLLKEIDKHELEQKKLANINNTGMWKVKYTVNEFGEKTGGRIIVNEKPISGSFSNTATQDSDLSVEFFSSFFWQ